MSRGDHRPRNDLPEACLRTWKAAGVLVHVLLPSVKMKGKAEAGPTHERELHDFLISRFGGYTVTGGNISGYWLRRGEEECNEHREYQIAVSGSSDLEALGDYLGKLARRLKERSVFCSIQGRAYLVKSAKAR